ncbi:MAG: hypothetical protein C0582_03655 [Alphaproteobacteria bacterium]|nr:MAG: hypothetical protein C0582_03655 [Alphaproteobacteria bacterium]
MLKVHNLSYQIKGKPLLTTLTATSKPGSFIGLIGENGAGKTTLLRALSGLLMPSQGRTTLNDTCLQTLSAPQRPSMLSYFSMEDVDIWQLHVQEILSLFAPNPSSRLYQELDIEKIKNHPFHTLSSGQKQRVVLALCLSPSVPLYLLDEPLNSLDHRHQHQVMRLLKKMSDQGRIVIASCHQLDLVKQYCTDIWLLQDGRLAQSGPTETALTSDTLETFFGISKDV